MHNKKGIALSINAIVVIAVAVVVLVVVLGFFVGGFGQSGSALRDVSVEAEDAVGDDVGSGVTDIMNIWKKGEGKECDLEKEIDCKSGLVCRAGVGPDDPATCQQINQQINQQ